MKKLLLIASLIICLVGCSNNEDIENNNPTSGDIQEIQQSGEQNVDLNKSFEERTKEVREIVNQPDSLGIEELGYVLFAEHFVSKASLEKMEDHYVMKVTVGTPKIYEKEEVENAYNLAQENGEYTLDGYTFYKDDNIPEIDENHAGWVESLKDDENMKLATKVVKSDDGSEYTNYIGFIITPNDENKYCVVELYSASAEGFIISEIEKEIDVILKSDDKVRIEKDDNYEPGTIMSTTVEELYNKALAEEEVSGLGFKLDLQDLGDSRGYYGGDQNAVEFTDADEIVIN